MLRNINLRCGAAVCAAAFSLLVAPAQADTIIDLTTADATGTSNGALYVQVPDQSTGTGVIEPFLRIQQKGTEQGYNSDVGGNDPWDTKSGTWTHDLLVSDLIGATIDGVDYYEFLLDINQTASNPLLSLNNVQIFTRTGAITEAPDSLAGLGDLRYNNDVGAQGDTTVQLNFLLNPGSGAGDMYMYVPVSAFAGALPTDNVYFYSLFGHPGNVSNDGFEEWALVGEAVPTTTAEPTTTNEPTTTDGPEPAALGLLGLGLLAVSRRIRRKKA
jgi:MYXO-CTERM domain-containing protein